MMLYNYNTSIKVIFNVVAMWLVWGVHATITYYTNLTYVSAIINEYIVLLCKFTSYSLSRSIID